MACKRRGGIFTKYIKCRSSENKNIRLAYHPQSALLAFDLDGLAYVTLLGTNLGHCPYMTETCDHQFLLMINQLRGHFFPARILCFDVLLLDIETSRITFKLLPQSHDLPGVSGVIFFLLRCILLGATIDVAKMPKSPLGPIRPVRRLVSERTFVQEAIHQLGILSVVLKEVGFAESILFML